MQLGPIVVVRSRNWQRLMHELNEHRARTALAPQLRADDHVAPVTPSPTRAAMIGAVDGWVNQFHLDGQVVGGPLDQSDDPALRDQLECVGGVAGRRVLELGPMEGAHTRLLCAGGVREVVAIEGHRDCWLRCLIVKEIFELRQARFLYGDFCAYLETTAERFDLALARGVLYHQRNPAQVILDLARVAPTVLVWTQIADAHPGPETTVSAGGATYRGRVHDYAGLRDRAKNYCGGVHPAAVWLYLDELRRAFHAAGFTRLEREQVAHTLHGPCVSFVASR